jgi:hypothetical protein
VLGFTPTLGQNRVATFKAVEFVVLQLAVLEFVALQLATMEFAVIRGVTSRSTIVRSGGRIIFSFLLDSHSFKSLEVSHVFV